MPRKRSARDEADTSKPKQLRKRLRKAEDQLADAVVKRDRAQARVEALSIIADEIRSQLAEAEAAAEKVAAAEKGATAEKGAAAEQAVSVRGSNGSGSAGEPGRKRAAKGRAATSAADADPGAAVQKVALDESSSVDGSGRRRRPKGKASAAKSATNGSSAEPASGVGSTTAP